MKKFLLGTTALISLSAASAAMAGGSHAPAAAAPANTGGLTVMVGGNFNFQSAFIDQVENGAGGLANLGSKDMAFRNDTTINITAAGSTEDFDYGAVIEMEGDTSEDKDSTGADNNSDKTYLYVENDSFGRFEAGATAGVSQTMEIDASNIARATGGIDGDTLYNIDLIGDDGVVTGSNRLVTAPNLVASERDDKAPDANKIAYYTPRFSGFQLGVSFTPDTGDSGTAAAVTSNVNGNFENVLAAGLGFEGGIADGATLMASAVGEWGNAEPTATGLAGNTLEDLSAYSVGLGLEFEGFSIAGNWADLGNSGQLIAATVEEDSSYWTLGAAYENGPYGVSVTYLNAETGSGDAVGAASDTGTHEFSNLVVGADYQMAPGLTPYIEAAFFDMENGGTTAADDNDGTVLLVGAEVAF